MSDYETTEQDVFFFKTPDAWPMWPFLPVKRRIEGQAIPDCQLLHFGIVGTKETLILVNANLFDRAAFDIAPRREVTVEQLIAEHWIVD